MKTNLSNLLLRLGFIMVAASTAATAQTYTDIYNFQRSGADNPRWSGIIAQGFDGAMYSTTGDVFGDDSGHAFKITPGGTFTSLAHFSESQGHQPTSGLTLADDGNFYGTANLGGDSNFGTVFRMKANGQLTIFHSFTNGADGSIPTAPPVQDLDGNLYGTTSSCIDRAGCMNPLGDGAVYKLTLAGEFSVLHTFVGSDGANPFGPLLLATDGNLYGTTSQGGKNGVGTIFKIGPAGVFETIFNFDSASGTHPLTPLIQGLDGNFYGVALQGGSDGGGTAFKFTPSGKLSVLHNFTGGADGSNQVGGLMQATDGNLYGTNNLGAETIFRVSPEGAFETIFTFNGSGGESPQATMLQHTNGVLYGTTALGRSQDVGVVFSLDMGLGPFVTFLPGARQVGNKVDILGQGLTGTTAVSFNGTAASFEVNSDTYITSTLPNGATSGGITVTTPTGVLTSNKQFLVKPQITGVSPSSGPVGTSVTVTGLSLTQTSEVKIGGVAAKFTVVSDDEVTATVPAGAVSGHRVAITTTGAATFSSDQFTVTP